MEKLGESQVEELRRDQGDRDREPASRFHQFSVSSSIRCLTEATVNRALQI
jgi:hypothetical protein